MELSQPFSKRHVISRLKNQKIALFALVGSIGVLVNSLILYLLITLGMHHIFAAIIATEIAIVSNFFGNHFITFRKNKSNKHAMSRFASFQAISLITLIGTVSLFAFLVHSFGENLLLLWNAAAILAMFLVNFFLNKTFTWHSDDKLRVPLLLKKMLQSKSAKLMGFLSVMLVLLAVPSLAQSVPIPGNQNPGAIAQVVDDIPGGNGDTADTTDEKVGTEQNQNESEDSDAEQSAQQRNDDEDKTTLIITSGPSGATIFINDEEVGESPITLLVDPGFTQVRAEMINHMPRSTTFAALPGRTRNIHLELLTDFPDDENSDDEENSENEESENNESDDSANNETQQIPSENGQNNTVTNDTNDGSEDVISNIKQSKTNLDIKNAQAGTYGMFESETATFEVTLNTAASVSWSVDGIVLKQESAAKSAFSWTPGLLFTSNIKQVIILAKTATNEKKWLVDVEFVANPYFSGPDNGADVLGSADSVINVYTNQRAFDPLKLSVVLENTDSGSKITQIYELVMHSNNTQKKEVHWQKAVGDLPFGNSYIVALIAQDKNGNDTIILPKSRAHYRTTPQNNEQEEVDEEEDEEDEDEDRIGANAGGGQFASNNNPELVYAFFVKDVALQGEEQTLKMDIKLKQGRISEVTAKIVTPRGIYLTKDLELDEGDGNYGTWSTDFMAFDIGEYVLESIDVATPDGASKEIKVRETSFYAAGDQESITPEYLKLVNVLLDRNEVSNGTSVELSVDIKDSMGITQAEVSVISSRGESFILPLELAAGDSNYGTWKSTVLAQTPDTTYTVESVSMANENSSITYPIKDRNFYVQSIASPLTSNMITGSVVAAGSGLKDWSFDTLRKVPLFPTLFGFMITLVLVPLALVGTGIGRIFRKNSR